MFFYDVSAQVIFTCTEMGVFDDISAQVIFSCAETGGAEMRASQKYRVFKLSDRASKHHVYKRGGGASSTTLRVV